MATKKLPLFILDCYPAPTGVAIPADFSIRDSKGEVHLQAIVLAEQLDSFMLLYPVKSVLYEKEDTSTAIHAAEYSHSPVIRLMKSQVGAVVPLIGEVEPAYYSKFLEYYGTDTDTECSVYQLLTNFGFNPELCVLHYLTRERITSKYYEDTPCLVHSVNEQVPLPEELGSPTLH